MSDLMGRVTILEERMDHQAAMLADLRGSVMDLRDEFRAFRDEFRAFREETNRRFEHVEQRFWWIIGFQLTTMVGVMGALLSALFLDR